MKRAEKNIAKYILVLMTVVFTVFTCVSRDVIAGTCGGQRECGCSWEGITCTATGKCWFNGVGGCEGHAWGSWQANTTCSVCGTKYTTTSGNTHAITQQCSRCGGQRIVYVQCGVNPAPPAPPRYTFTIHENNNPYTNTTINGDRSYTNYEGSSIPDRSTPSNIPTGWHFMGYYSNSGTSNKDNKYVDANGHATVSLSGNMDGYGYYARNRYTVRYDTNTAGKVVDNAFNLSDYYYYYGADSDFIDYQDGTSKSVATAYKLQPCVLRVHGYTFGGWYYNGHLVSKWMDIQNLADTSILNQNGSVMTVTANWNRCDGNLYLYDDGRYLSGSLSAVDTKTLYKQIPLYDVETLPNLSNKTYTVTCTPNDANAVIAGKSAGQNWSEAVTRQFQGWTVTQGDKWALQSGKLTNNNTTNGSECVASSIYASKATVLPSATRDGYAFLGWYTAEDGGVCVGTGGSEYVPSGDVTLYAHWDKIAFNLSAQGFNNTQTTNLSWQFEAEVNGSLNASYQLYRSGANETDITNAAKYSSINNASDGGAVTGAINTNLTTNGQTYTVPSTGFYSITTYGAKGGAYGSYSGGNGSYIPMKVYLKKGDVIKFGIISGGAGGGEGAAGGNAGVMYINNTIYAVAGSGGGASLVLGGTDSALSNYGIATSTGSASSTGGGGGAGVRGGSAGYITRHYHSAVGSLVSGSALADNAAYNTSGGCYTNGVGYNNGSPTGTNCGKSNGQLICTTAEHTHSTSCYPTVAHSYSARGGTNEWCQNCKKTVSVTTYKCTHSGCSASYRSASGCSHLGTSAPGGYCYRSTTANCGNSEHTHSTSCYHYHGSGCYVYGNNATKYTRSCGYADRQILGYGSSTGGACGWRTAGSGNVVIITAPSSAIPYGGTAAYLNISASTSETGMTVGKTLDDVSTRDINAPDKPVESSYERTPKIEQNGNTTVYTGKWTYKWSKPAENGTKYWFYANAYHISGASVGQWWATSNNKEGTRTITPVSVNITTGLDGYYVYIDSNPSTEVASLAAAQLASATYVNGEDGLVSNPSVTRDYEPANSGTRYVHVAYRDKAGNIGASLHHKIETITVNTPQEPIPMSHCGDLGTPNITVTNETDDTVHYRAQTDTWYVKTDDVTAGAMIKVAGTIAPYSDNEYSRINKLFAESDAGEIGLIAETYNYTNDGILWANTLSKFNLLNEMTGDIQSNYKSVYWQGKIAPLSESAVSLTAYGETKCTYVECANDVVSVRGNTIKIAADITAPDVSDNGTVDEPDTWKDFMSYDMYRDKAKSPVKVRITDNGSGLASVVLYEEKGGSVKQSASDADLQAAQASGYYDLVISNNAEGIHYYYLVATDNVGNTTEITIEVAVDDIPPLVDPIGPLDPDENITYSGSQTIEYNWTNKLILRYKVWDEETQVKSAILYDDKGKRIAATEATDIVYDENGHETYDPDADNTTVKFEDEEHLYEGRHEFHLVVIDTADNKTDIKLIVRADYTDIKITGLELIESAAKEMENSDVMTFDATQWEDFDITVEADDTKTSTITSGIKNFKVEIENSDSGVKEVWSTDSAEATDSSHILVITEDNGDYGIYKHNEKSTFTVDAFVQTCANKDLFTGHWTINATALDYAGNKAMNGEAVEEISLTATLSPYYGTESILGAKNELSVYRLGETLELDIKTEGYVDAVYIELTPKSVLYNSDKFTYGARLYKGYSKGNTLNTGNSEFEIIPVSDANDKLLYCINPKDISSKGAFDTTVQLLLPLYLQGDQTIEKCNINVYAIRINGDFDDEMNRKIINGISEGGYDNKIYENTINSIKKGASFYIASEYNGGGTSLLDDFETLLK